MQNTGSQTRAQFLPFLGLRGLFASFEAGERLLLAERRPRHDLLALLGATVHKFTGRAIG
jgi:hypothetical protein